MTNFEYALFWHGRGLNVVPRKSADFKHPAVRWKRFQIERVSLSELRNWKALFDSGGVGFVTGAISNIIVIETDGPKGEALIKEFEQRHGPLPATLVIRSGSGRGVHRYFKHPGCRVPTQANPAIEVDIKGDGGFCVLPPSAHQSGGRYQIVQAEKPADLPDGLLVFICVAAKANKGKLRSDMHAARIAGGDQELKSNVDLRRLPINRTNVGLIQSILDALPEEWANDYDLWLSVGMALHHFDPGQVGLALWKQFSKRHHDKAAATDFKNRWASFDGESAGRKVTLGTIIAAAKGNSWVATCRWDHST